MIIGASRHAADDLARTACETALIGVERFSLREFVSAISSDAMSSRGLVPLTRIAREALAAAAAASTPLTYLTPVSRFPGFPRALARTLEDLRLNRIDPERVKSCGRSGPALAALLEAYERQLDSCGFADYAMRVQLAINGVKPRPALLLDVKARTALERELIAALDQVGPTLHIGSEGTADIDVSLLSAPSEALECIEIARRILESGVPFDRCAVLLRNPARHEPLLREAFNRAGIPARFASGARRPDLGGRALIALLRCREEDLSVSAFAEYLSLAQTPREEGQSTAGWERELRAAAVVAGQERWRSRLEALANKLDADYGQTPEPRIARRIGRLEALRGFALPVIDRLAALPQSARWGEWIEAIDALTHLVLKNPRSARELLSELRPLADFGPLSLQHVILTLQRNLMTWQEDEESTRYGKVFVASVEEARGMSFRNVYVPGLNEGLFPRPFREDPLLLDAQRTELGMETSRDDAELLDIVCACASETAVFSYSRLDLATGRERVKSFFAYQVMPPLGEDRVETTIGWSAPQDPMRAIDDIEYDLSSIRQSWDKPGSSAWLADTNPHLARSIRARQRRWSPEWSDADGLAGQDIHAAQLLSSDHGLKSRSWSPSALQDFAQCPYRFYLRGVLGLHAVEEPIAPQRMDPRTRGDLYHRVQRELNERVTPDSLEVALQRLDEIIVRVSAELAAEHDPAIPSVWQAGVDAVRGDLRGWLYYRAWYESEWTPVAAEQKFDVTLENGFRLTGSIDLIEHDDAGHIRITDFKTGVAPRDRLGCIGRGEVLQPALYALAAESLGHDVQSTRLLYATLRSNFRNDFVPFDSGARILSSNVLATINAWIAKGFLPAAPRADACDRCEFVPICGPYEEIRVKCKSPAELRQLTSIREAP